MACKHETFEVTGRVGRLCEKEGGPITAYTIDVTVKCTQCDIPFRFIGNKFGSSPFEPRLSADSLQLRAPLEPAHAPEILGQPLVSGRA